MIIRYLSYKQRCQRTEFSDERDRNVAYEKFTDIYKKDCDCT